MLVVIAWETMQGRKGTSRHPQEKYGFLLEGKKVAILRYNHCVGAGACEVVSAFRFHCNDVDWLMTGILCVERQVQANVLTFWCIYFSNVEFCLFAQSGCLAKIVIIDMVY